MESSQHHSNRAIKYSLEEISYYPWTDSYRNQKYQEAPNGEVLEVEEEAEETEDVDVVVSVEVVVAGSRQVEVEDEVVALVLEGAVCEVQVMAVDLVPVDSVVGVVDTYNIFPVVVLILSHSLLQMLSHSLYR